MSDRQAESAAQPSDRAALYSDLQRAIPGLDAMYALACAAIDARVPHDGRILVVGAGGGRELAGLCDGRHRRAITAIDPSASKLALAKRAARQAGVEDTIDFVTTPIDALPRQAPFDGATSLLVMHQLADDDGKLAYLTSLRERLSEDGVLVHADVCLDGRDELDVLVPAFLQYAQAAGIDPATTRFELDALSRLPIVSESRTCELFAGAGLAPPRALFRSLWYRCWLTGR
ncbi:MAG: class I SAM-dependent methyltransferase [Rhodocyclaceae bacterium]|nr:class I SAM-dependent methyltransferase [Rhodocyclaceae bacterium]